MRIYSDELLSVGWLSGKVLGPRLSATFFLKAAYALKNGEAPAPVSEPMLPSGDLNAAVDGKEVLKYSSDFVPFKPRGDILVIGTGYAPGGKASSGFPVSIRVGNVRKTLDVVGDRAWERGLLFSKAGQPQTISKLPLIYANSWGGENYKWNPQGRGHKTDRMHNIERPGAWAKGPGDELVPAGFGPLADGWEPRKSMVGTYKGNWFKERWPWFPDDFDWGYFNAAPLDQQVEGYLRGDEEIEFTSLHPQQIVYRSKLPGLRARCFFNERLPEGGLLFREAPLKLDTLWIDMDAEMMVLVWRGLADVRTLKLKEIEHVFAITEAITEQSRTVEGYKMMLERRFISPADPEIEAAKVQQAGLKAAFARRFADLAKEFAEVEKEGAQAQALADQVTAERNAQLIAHGFDAKLLEPQPAPHAPFSLRDLKDSLEKSSPLKGMTFPELEEAEKDLAAMDKEMPESTPPRPSRESVQAGIAAGADGARFAKQDFSGLDLSGLDLSGADLSLARFSKANLTGAMLARANLSESDLTGANLTDADLTGATLAEADLTDATLTGAKLAKTSLAGAILSGLNIEGVDFTGCHGKGVDFSGANLARARFVEAKLPQADFSGANIEQADFNSAELTAAQFDGAKGRGVKMEKADISGLQGGAKADFTNGNFRSAKGAGSIWEQSLLDEADFSSALLTRSNFNEASLNGARFDRANAMKASFDDASLQRATLTNANMLRTTFARANLTHADLSNSNFFEAGFWETKFGQTISDGGNFRRTLMA